MARRKRGLMRRLALHAGLAIDAACKVLFDKNRPHQRVFIDGGGMYSFGHDWPRSEPDPEMLNRIMRLEAEHVYLRERLRTVEANQAKRKRYHKFHSARSWGR